MNPFFNEQDKITQQSRGMRYGVTYSNFFALNEYAKKKNSNEVSALSLNSDDQGQLFFETKFSLDDNFSNSNILRVNVEGEINDENLAPVTYVDGTTSLDNYLTIAFYLQSDFIHSATGAVNCNNSRNHIYMSLTDNIISHRAKELDTGIEAFNINSDTSNSYYYLQDSDLYDSIYTNGNEFLNYPLQYQMYSYAVGGDPVYHISSNVKFLGNINIVRPEDLNLHNNSVASPIPTDATGLYNKSLYSEGSPSYWVEDRPYLQIKHEMLDICQNNNLNRIYPKGDDSFLHFEYPSITLAWPDEEEESSCF